MHRELLFPQAGELLLPTCTTRGNCEAKIADGPWLGDRLTTRPLFYYWGKTTCTRGVRRHQHPRPFGFLRNDVKRLSPGTPKSSNKRRTTDLLPFLTAHPHTHTLTLTKPPPEAHSRTSRRTEVTESLRCSPTRVYNATPMVQSQRRVADPGALVVSSSLPAVLPNGRCHRRNRRKRERERGFFSRLAHSPRSRSPAQRRAGPVPHQKSTGGARLTTPDDPGGWGRG